MTTIDLLTLIGGDVTLRRVATTHGGEYAGPCPFCGGGTDRLRVWPQHPGGKGGQWWCRGCNKGGDGIAYRVERGDLTPADAGRLRRGDDLGLAGLPTRAAAPLSPPLPRAPDVLAAPGPQWQAAARAFVARCEAALWGDGGARALAWLRGRGLSDDTIRAAGLGYNGQDEHQKRQAWGLAEGNAIWLPRGIVIPWVLCGDLWRVNIRRPLGDPKYYSPAGFSNGLYNADALTPDRPAILAEGEIDALTLGQVADELVVPVASGSTGGSRRTRWIAALAMCPAVLVAYDTDDAGQKAAAWWVDKLSNSRRWRPFWNDANAMHQGGADVRGWVLAALDGAARRDCCGAATIQSDPTPTTPDVGNLAARVDAVAAGIADQARRLVAIETEHGPALSAEALRFTAAVAPFLQDWPQLEERWPGLRFELEYLSDTDSAALVAHGWPWEVPGGAYE